MNKANVTLTSEKWKQEFILRKATPKNGELSLLDSDSIQIVSHETSINYKIIDN